MTAEEEAALTDLGHHWGHVYAIAMCDGIWTAQPYDRPASILTADSADQLRKLIRQDYRGRPYESASL